MKRNKYLLVIAIILPVLFIFIVYHSFVNNLFEYEVDVYQLLKQVYGENISKEIIGQFKYINRTPIRIIGNNQKGEKILDFINYFTSYIDEDEDDIAVSTFTISYYGKETIENANTYTYLFKIRDNIVENDTYNVYMKSNSPALLNPEIPYMDEIIICTKDINNSNMEVFGNPSLYDLKLTGDCIVPIVSIILIILCEVAAIFELTKGDKIHKENSNI